MVSVSRGERPVAAGPSVAQFEGRVLNVRDGDAIGTLAEELGAVDIVFSNATSRMSPEADPADEVDAVAETNNLAATRILREFAPRLRPDLLSAERRRSKGCSGIQVFRCSGVQVFGARRSL